MAPMNISGYVRWFDVTDERTEARGLGSGADAWPIYLSVKPRGQPRLTCDPYIRRLTNEYNPYIH
jgi:hypothetical protein